MFDPDLIVVSDIMARGGAILLEGMNTALERHLSPFYHKPQIVLADPSDDLVLLGAVTIAIDRIFSKPTGFLMSKNASRSVRVLLGPRSKSAAAEQPDPPEQSAAPQEETAS